MGSCDLQLNVTEFRYNWTVRPFSMADDVIESCQFTSGISDTRQWRLKLTKVKQLFGATYIWLIVSLNTDSNVKTSFSCGLIGEDGEELHKCAATSTFSKSNPKYECTDFLRDSEKLVGDTMRLTCKFRIVENVVRHSSPLVLTGGSLQRDFENLYLTKERSDLLISVDGDEFKAHKLILSTRSAVLPALLSCEATRLELSDISAATFENILRFMYIDEVDAEVLRESAPDLLKGAEVYELATLKTIAEDHLIHALNTKNVLDSVLLADEFKSDRLKKEVFHFLLANLDSMRGTERWVEFAKEHPRLIVEMLTARASGPSTQHQTPETIVPNYRNL